jgi:hypothetical protein
MSDSVPPSLRAAGFHGMRIAAIAAITYSLTVITDPITRAIVAMGSLIVAWLTEAPKPGKLK